MADPTLIQNIKTYFTSDFYKIAAQRLDEKSYETEKALSAIIPLISAALLNKATSGKEGCETVYQICKKEADRFSVDFDFSKLDPKHQDTSFYLIKEKKHLFESEIAAYAGIKPSSVAALLSMAVPSILGLAGKHATRNELSASGLAGYLSSQEYFIITNIPQPLNSFEKYFDLVPAKKSNISHWDYSFKKFSSSDPRVRSWIISLIVIIIMVVLYIMAAT